MATAAQNIGTAIAGLSAQIATVLASPLPDITVDGVTVNRQTYYQSLMARLKELIEIQQKCDGPFTMTSVVR